MSLCCQAINKTKQNKKKFKKRVDLRQWFLSGGGFAPQVTFDNAVHVFCFLQLGGWEGFTGI